MKVKVKICGIRNMNRAIASVDAGADFLGLQFVPTSKRKIAFSTAKSIAKQLKGKIGLVGVFKDQTVEEINKICEKTNIDYVQLHGDEDHNFCTIITAPVIKAFGLPKDFSLDQTIQKMQKYAVSYFLIDREKRGTGTMLSLQNAVTLAKKFPLFFAGNLNPFTITTVIKQVKPFAVDVASGIETDGEIDIKKMKLFIKNAKG